MEFGLKVPRVGFDGVVRESESRLLSTTQENESQEIKPLRTRYRRVKRYRVRII